MSDNNKRRGYSNFLAKFLTKKVINIALIVLLISAIGIGIGTTFFTESKTTKIGFEDIGELATQSAYCTEINITESGRELFGIQIPFTQSKYIYSYDVVIKAGFDFNDITWNISKTSIDIQLPEPKVLSNNIDLNSFKIYHEKESIFRQIKMDENNQALLNMKKSAEENAIENGLLDNARANAEIILTGFFGNVYDLNKYKINFTYKK